MPTYAYRCTACGTESEDFALIKDRKGVLPCPKCGKGSPRYFGNHQVGLKDNPRKSVAMGVHPSQIEAATKKWPGSRYDSSGALLIANRTEKKLRMKQRGWMEYN